MYVGEGGSAKIPLSKKYLDPGIDFANASILCTALGGDRNKDPSLVYIVDLQSLLLFPPETCAYNNLRVFL